MVELEEYQFDITNLVPGILWDQFKSMKSADNILRANRVRKWVAEELATEEGWDVEFNFTHESRMAAILTINDASMATYFKLKWVV